MLQDRISLARFCQENKRLKKIEVENTLEHADQHDLETNVCYDDMNGRQARWNW